MAAWCYWISFFCFAEFAMYKADDDDAYISPHAVAYTISSAARDSGTVEMKVSIIKYTLHIINKR